jgi:cyclophilin family peptidyl-prolyl cis-trans isomerase/HEAT repeat protein
MMRGTPLLAAGISCLLLTHGCGPPPPPPNVGGAALGVPDLEVRALLLLLADRQIYEPVTVREALKGDAALRQQLALTLGRARDLAGEHVLAELLRDDDAGVRRTAAFALGILGDPRAQPDLLVAVHDSDEATGRRAVEALGRLGAPVVETAQQLLSLAEPERWKRLLPPLFHFREAAMVPLAEHGLGLGDPALVSWSVYALARDPLPASAPLLRPVLHSAAPQLRAWAARALGRVGNAADLELLLPLLSENEASPVVQALGAGRSLLERPSEAAPAAPPASWRPAFLRLLADLRPHVRQAALEAVRAWLPDGSLAAALVEIAGRASGRERGLALVALAQGREPAARALVEAGAHATDTEVRARAAEAAVLLADDALLVRLISDPSPPVRVAAYNAALPSRVSAGTAGERQAEAMVRRGLSDPSEGVRAVVLEWLIQHPLLSGEDLQSALVRALADPSTEPALYALRALAARAAMAPLERGAIVTTLEKATASGSYVTEREAGVQLGKLDRPVPPLAEPLPRRELSYYRDVLNRTRAPRTVVITTAKGAITIRLACPEAPMTCLNFLELAAQHFFDGLPFHRVVPDFVVQGGDPDRDGYGGPGYSLRNEATMLSFDHRGVVGMALAGPDTAGSQFFVTLGPAPHLDGAFTAFGEVIAGDAVLAQLVPGDEMLTIRETH